MSSSQDTDRNLRYSSQPSADSSIRGQLSSLSSEGAYLIKQIPSDLDDDFLIRLESLVNALYFDLDKEITSGHKIYKVKSLTTLMKIIDEQILPVVSEWSDYVKKNPNGPRPRDLFKNMKSVGW